MLILLSSHTAASAQGKASQDQLKHLLEVSRHRSQLEMDGTPPFHLAATYEQFDSAGKTVGRGSLDELWVHSKRYRQTLILPEIEEVKSGNGMSFREVLTAPPRQLVEMDSGSQAWRTGRWVLFADILGPLMKPFSLKLDGSERLTVQSTPVKPSGLDCVGTEPELEGVPKENPVAITTFCMAPGSHLLRLVSRPSGIDIAFNDVQRFGEKYIARSIEMFSRKKLVVRIHVDVLEPASDSKELDMPAPATAQLLNVHRADLSVTTGELMVGQLLKKVSPLYPQAGLRGTIKVKFRVNTSGEVESEDVLEAENQLLKAPVMTALKEWRFRVSYRGKEPTAVDHVYRFSFGGEEELQ